MSYLSVPYRYRYRTSTIIVTVDAAVTAIAVTVTNALHTSHALATMCSIAEFVFR